MKIAECPICEAKFDISNVPEQTKVRCGQCKRVFGLIQDGEVIPYFEELTLAPIAEQMKPLAPPTGQPETEPEEVEPEPEYERIIIRRRVPEPQAETTEEKRLDPLLLIAGLVSLAAIIVLIYTFTEINRPVESYLRDKLHIPASEERPVK